MVLTSPLKSRHAFGGILPIMMLAILLALSGCSNNPQRKGPEETAEAFLRAMQFGDYDKAATFCSEGTAKNLTLMKTMSDIGANPLKEDFEITSVKEDGEYATVKYDQGDKKGKVLQLREDDHHWVVLANKADFSGDDSKKKKSPSFDLNLDDDEGEDDEIEVEKKSKPLPSEKYQSYRDGKSAKQTAEAFLKAIQYGKYKTAMRYGSKSTNENLGFQESMSSLDSDKDESGDVEILRVKEDGDYAKVYYQEEGKKREKVLKLGKDEKDNWEVIMSKSDMSDDDEE